MQIVSSGVITEKKFINYVNTSVSQTAIYENEKKHSDIHAERKRNAQNDSIEWSIINTISP